MDNNLFSPFLLIFHNLIAPKYLCISLSNYFFQYILCIEHINNEKEELRVKGNDTEPLVTQSIKSTNSLAGQALHVETKTEKPTTCENNVTD